MMEEWISTTDAAQKAGVTRQGLTEAAKLRNELIWREHQKGSRKVILIRTDSLNAWIQQRTHKQQEAAEEAKMVEAEFSGEQQGGSVSLDRFNKGIALNMLPGAFKEVFLAMQDKNLELMERATRAETTLELWQEKIENVQKADLQRTKALEQANKLSEQVAEKDLAIEDMQGQLERLKNERSRAIDQVKRLSKEKEQASGQAEKLKTDLDEIKKRPIAGLFRLFTNR